MNAEEDVLSRLLRLYPIRAIKDFFEVEERLQDDIIDEVVENYTFDSIKSFSYDNFEITKQTVYVYSIRNRYAHVANINSDDLGATILSQTLNDGAFVMHGYHDVNYDVRIFDGAIQDVSISLMQPFKVKIVDNYLIIYVTKLEPSPKSFFDHDVTIIANNKVNFDSIIIGQVLQYFQDNFRLNPQQCDLNQGIKNLWEGNVIDAKELSFRKTSSRAKEVMDGDELFKERYPDEYDDVMNKPLELCTFRYLLEDDEWTRYFACDPRIGKISFSIYSDNNDQTNNVIDGIIGNN